MFGSYLKIAWRHLIKQKTYSQINISGLAIGVASCLIIYIYVHSELTYDQDAVAIDRIVRVNTTISSTETDTRMALAPGILATTLQRELPEVETTVRLLTTTPEVKLNGEFFSETAFVKSDPSVFSIFKFQFIEGESKGALDLPNSIVLTQKLAEKYFGSNSALGKTLLIDGQNWIVKGVVKNRPPNTDLKMCALMSADFDKDKAWLKL